MSEAKNIKKSWTVWFGVICIVLGVAYSILEFLSQQDIINVDAGVVGVVYGIITIALRFKTKAAIALKIDDPTTPEDESKGEPE